MELWNDSFWDGIKTFQISTSPKAARQSWLMGMIFRLCCGARFLRFAKHMGHRLTDNQISGILEILKENKKLQKVVLYGSRAKGNFSPGSDIDLALTGDSLDFNDIVDYKVKLDNLPILNKIDLVIYDQIKEPALIEHIKRIGKVIYQRPG